MKMYFEGSPSNQPLPRAEWVNWLYYSNLLNPEVPGAEFNDLEARLSVVNDIFEGTSYVGLLCDNTTLDDHLQRYQDLATSLKTNVKGICRFSEFQSATGLTYDEALAYLAHFSQSSNGIELSSTQVRSPNFEKFLEADPYVLIPDSQLDLLKALGLEPFVEFEVNQLSNYNIGGFTPNEAGSHKRGGNNFLIPGYYQSSITGGRGEDAYMKLPQRRMSEKTRTSLQNEFVVLDYLMSTRCSGHVLLYYPYDEEQYEGYLVLKRVTGDTLSTMIGSHFESNRIDPNDEKPVQRAMRAALAAQLAHVVQEQINVGVFHQDLKPENLIYQFGWPGPATITMIDYESAKLGQNTKVNRKEYAREMADVCALIFRILTGRIPYGIKGNDRNLKDPVSANRRVLYDYGISDPLAYELAQTIHMNTQSGVLFGAEYILTDRAENYIAGKSLPFHFA